MALPTFTIIELPAMAEKETYPPVGFFVAESEPILRIWETFLKNNPPSDPRINNGKLHPTHLLDHSKLKYRVKKGENIIFKDSNTGRVFGMVWQDVVGDEEVVKALSSTIIEHLNHTTISLRVTFLL